MQIAKLIKENLKALVKEYYDIELGDVFLEHPDNEKWGDYATNLPMQLAGRVKQSPVEIAKKLSYGMTRSTLSFTLDDVLTPIFDKIDFTDAGFLNFTFSTECLNYLLNSDMVSDSNYGGTGLFENTNAFENKEVVIEYTDPNPFKEFHIGHLMSNSIGESLSRIFEYGGAKVIRANYQGDVGMHVSKSIWGLQKMLVQEDISLVDLSAMPLEEIASFLGKSYAFGATAYEEDEQAQKEMQALNYALYIISQKMHMKEGHSPKVDYEKHLVDFSNDYLEKVDLAKIEELYIKGRQWSLDYFETLYKRLGTKFDKYYFESLMGELGYEIVQAHLGDVFTQDNGAIIFKGEDFGLHTRVFINSLGLPTYEAKELGLAYKKYEDFKFDTAVVVTGNEINDYFKVVLKALDKINSEIASKIEHISHGMMRLSDGKMSSRTGKIVTGKVLLDEVQNDVKDKMQERGNEDKDNVVSFTKDELEDISNKLAVSAIKYSILKNSIGRDIVYDPEKALDVKGNTGPYLQYTFVRAKSILEKATRDLNIAQDFSQFVLPSDLSDEEKSLLRFTYQFSEACDRALIEKSPHFICDYLFSLCQKFNLFYANVPILSCDDNDSKTYRLFLARAVTKILEKGLYLLGIETVSKM